MRILVASDLSARSDRALARGVLLAREHTADLRVLHVVDADLPQELRHHSVDWARKAISAEIAALPGSRDLKIEIDVREGHAGSEVTRECQPDRTDLAILGVHNTTAPGSRRFARTTAGFVLRSSLAPILLVKRDSVETYRRLVVGVDFSMFSALAVRQALKFAPSAAVNLVHAYRLPFQGILGDGSFEDAVAYDQRLELDAFLAAEMTSVDEKARQFGVETGTLVKTLKEGLPVQVLREECARVDADLLVIGTHGRAGMTRAIWGSVAEDLLDFPPCDVFVIRPY